MDEWEIFARADRFLKSIVQVDGAIGINPDAESGMRLVEDGVSFPDLPLNSLCAALAASVQTLTPAKNVLYTHWDHVVMWSWCAQIIAHNDTEYFSMEEMNLKQLVQALVHAVKAHRVPANIPRREDFDYSIEGVSEFSRLRNEALACVALPSTVEQFLSFNSLIVSYLSFPLLEGILKKACVEYVDFDGEVKKEFRISPSERSYSVGKKISNVGVLLFLYFELAAGDFEKKYLTFIVDHLKTFGYERHPFWMIFDWRNQSLHGQQDHITVGGILLSMSLLIAVASLGERFEGIRERRKGLVELAPPSTAATALYPPFNR